MLRIKYNVKNKEEFIKNFLIKNNMKKVRDDIKNGM